MTYRFVLPLLLTAMCEQIVTSLSSTSAYLASGDGTTPPKP